MFFFTRCNQRWSNSIEAFPAVLDNLHPFACSSSLQKYEQLAAQLDGAKTHLTKKVNEVSEAAAKDKIVEAAEEHATTLNKLANDLEKYVFGA